ncbi:hypothetical protein DMC30DRAFT_347515 [Rhodotorula diobovata]|uniref:Maintenance of telomere capping protein 1 n=1 Tax=Rhodotorula diobovata TaxID=5288 RepID=A0A5C5G2H4_9BASI|nr:hypothetical protein DMC30DRAFT_347515 [Rhodotorula diobovata]
MAQPTHAPLCRNRDDVLQLLDSLDTYSNPPPPSTTTSAKSAKPAPPTSLPRSSSNHSALSSSTSGTRPAPPPSGGSSAGAQPGANAAEAQSVLDFLDEITQRSSTPTTQSLPRPLDKKASVPTGLGRSTSRNNLSGVASSPGTATGAGAGAPPRRSTDSARSVRSVGAASGGGSGVSASPRSTAARAPPAASAAQAAPAPAAAAPAAPQPDAQQPPAAAAAEGGGGGWGWSSMWSQATTVVQQASHLAQQARTAAEEQVKTAAAGAGAAGGIAGLGEGLIKKLGENEQAKKWSEGVMSYAKGAHLDQLGKDLKSTTLRSLTDLLNAVAPPIAEHEVIQVSLSHDMVGYDGVETLVYRGLAKIMEQVEGGTLVVNSAAGEKPAAPEDDDDLRDLNLVDGLAEGWKLAEASLDQLIKDTYEVPVPPSEAENGATVPVTTCPVYLRIQPVLAPLPSLPASLLPSSSSSDAPSTSTSPSSTKALFFLLLLRDPTHSLVHASTSQSMPATWLDIPFEDNEWVEDAMVEIIRRSVEIVGQEYIAHRCAPLPLPRTSAPRVRARLTGNGHGPRNAGCAPRRTPSRRRAQRRSRSCLTSSRPRLPRAPARGPRTRTRRGRMRRARGRRRRGSGSFEGSGAGVGASEGTACCTTTGWGCRCFPACVRV